MTNEQVATHAMANGTEIQLVQGDITEERVDAIVNAANSHLQHGGGVAAAISRKGGPDIQRKSNAVGFVPTGQAAATGAGRLPCRFVIHAVGPIWGSGNEDALLRSAASRSLELADERELQSISLPAISSGIYGFPKDRCAEVLLAAAQDYATEHPGTSLRVIRFCIYDEPTMTAFQAAWRSRFGEGAGEERTGG